MKHPFPKPESLAFVHHVHNKWVVGYNAAILTKLRLGSAVGMFQLKKVNFIMHHAQHYTGTEEGVMPL